MSTALTAARKDAYVSVADMLEKNKTSMAQAIPKHMSIDRFTRIALSELRTNPKLLECSPASLMSCLVKSSQLGLEVGSAMGHAYLVPYKTECTLIIGYRGLITLARRSGEIVSITARIVHENDLFELEYGLDEKLRHVPAIDNPGKMTHVYAVAKLKDGGIQYDVMTRAEVEAIRKRSRAGNGGPWASDYEEMARKTVLRRLCKYLPISIELSDAIATDDERPELAERHMGSASVVDLNARLSAQIDAPADPEPPHEPSRAYLDLMGLIPQAELDELAELVADLTGFAEQERERITAAAETRRAELLA